MSELAFNANGESFEVPATVTGWRVRRMKPRGAPELVYGRDGRPLTIPVESDLDDLRESVGVVGKYRLDPINDDGKAVEHVPAAYIQVVRPERIEAPSSVAVSASGTSDDTVREAMRMNTELAKAVIDRFPEMMQAAAVLLRAADGAGLPARPGLVIDTDDETDDEQPETPSGGFDLNALVAQVVPLIVMSLGKGKLKMPDLGSVLDWRKASPQKQITDHKEAAPTAKPAAEAKPVELPPLDPATMAHFIAVQSALKPEEAALAREVAGDLEPGALRAWFDELSKLSVPDAVAKIRALIGKGGAS